jgi:hypothetical protein
LSVSRGDGLAKAKPAGFLAFLYVRQSDCPNGD